jgi:hypothetical protein
VRRRSALGELVDAMHASRWRLQRPPRGW